MKRREFITWAGATATAFSGRSSPRLAAGPHWQRDGVGSLARIGVLTPAFDPVPESEMWAMAPQGISLHASRVRWTPAVAQEAHGARGEALRVMEARSFAEPPHVDSAAELLAGLKPRVILYAFTSSSYVLGAEADESLKARLEKRAGGIPVLLTVPAASEALRLLRLHRVALIHPPWFTEEVNAQGREYFRARGIEVVFCAPMTPIRPFTEVPPAEVYDWTKASVPPNAEAVFIGGNGLRAIGVIEALEEALGRPVLTANQVLFWQALRVLGVTSTVSQYGRIFTQRAAQQ